jgi:hypothetical protein
LSRRVADLKEQLGVRLIERSAKGLELTEGGRQLLSQAERPMSEVVNAFTSAREGGGKVSGRLRVAAPVVYRPDSTQRRSRPAKEQAEAARKGPLCGRRRQRSGARHRVELPS